MKKEDELILVPRKEYEEFSQWRKTAERPRKFKTFKPTSVELKTLKRVREDYKKGKYTTLDEFERKLGFKNQG